MARLIFLQHFLLTKVLSNVVQFSRSCEKWFVRSLFMALWIISLLCKRGRSCPGNTSCFLTTPVTHPQYTSSVLWVSLGDSIFPLQTASTIRNPEHACIPMIKGPNSLLSRHDRKYIMRLSPQFFKVTDLLHLSIRCFRFFSLTFCISSGVGLSCDRNYQSDTVPVFRNSDLKRLILLAKDAAFV